MSINLKLTLQAVCENIRKQEYRKELLKKQILSECPYKVGEEVFFVRTHDHYKAIATIRAIMVSDSGDYIYRLSAIDIHGRIRSLDLSPGYFIEKKATKKFNHEHTEQRFRSVK